MSPSPARPATPSVSSRRISEPRRSTSPGRRTRTLPRPGAQHAPPGVEVTPGRPPPHAGHHRPAGPAAGHRRPSPHPHRAGAGHLHPGDLRRCPPGRPHLGDLAGLDAVHLLHPGGDRLRHSRPQRPRARPLLRWGAGRGPPARGLRAAAGRRQRTAGRRGRPGGRGAHPRRRRRPGLRPRHHPDHRPLGRLGHLRDRGPEPRRQPADALHGRRRRDRPRPRLPARGPARLRGPAARGPLPRQPLGHRRAQPRRRARLHPDLRPQRRTSPARRRLPGTGPPHPARLAHGHARGGHLRAPGRGRPGGTGAGHSRPGHPQPRGGPLRRRRHRPERGLHPARRPARPDAGGRRAPGRLPRLGARAPQAPALRRGLRRGLRRARAAPARGRRRAPRPAPQRDPALPGLDPRQPPPLRRRH